MASKPIRRNRHGGVDLRLSSDERDLLLSLGPQLRALLTDTPQDPILKRLFPPAYVEDTEAESFYRLLARDELVNRRLANLDNLERAARADKLSPEEALAFLNALNDLRLVLGTRLEVTEDDDPSEIDPSDPEAGLHSVYHYLGWLLELTLEALA
ncbi:MAG: hypothetical protein JWL70_3107 [Acidimicrobiia bacterium]|nr:hypothetical protein [Acidimicrobiia bacterium]